jgi:hypothetical protein
MSFLAKWQDWVDNEAPPWLNLIITAGFHTAFTLATGQFGLSGYAAFGYGMKEGGPFLGNVVTGKLGSAYQPTDRQARRGWTRRWVIADSIADVAGPVLVHLLYVF